MEPASLEQYAEFRPAWQAFAVYFFGVLVFAGGPQLNPDTHISPALGQLIASLFLAFILLKRLGSLYQVGPQGVTVETVFPRRRRRQVAMAEIRRIDLRRGITQRLLGVAHVHIYVQDQETPALKLFGVAQPERLRQLLIDLGARDEQVLGAWRR